MNKQLFTFLFLFLGGTFLYAQSSSNQSLADRFLQGKAKELGLTSTDFDDLYISDAQERENGIAHLYMMQTIEGIPIYNANLSVHIKNGQVMHFTNNAERDIYNKANSSSPTLNVEEGVIAAAKICGFSASVDELSKMDEERGDTYFFAPTEFSKSRIKADLYYYVVEDAIKLIWKVDLDVPGDDFLSVKVDAHTGEKIDVYNYTLFCSFDAPNHTTHTEECTKHQETSSAVNLSEPGTYRVYAPPVRSPKNNETTLSVAPALLSASPYRWHDVNGEEGAEYTITRGNNVHAYLDKNDDNSSDGGEPDGGPELLFDFSHDKNAEPEENILGAQVNLFHMVNYLHDFSYQFGFDELSGNFQRNNYNNGGNQFDEVLAEAQDGSGTDNANFSTPEDGYNGRMQMYLWGANSNDVIHVTSPDILVGSYESQQASFGADVTNDAVSGKIVVVDDGTPNGSQGCNSLQNVEEVNGNIAMIDRGSCDFDLKCGNAEAAGAIAVLVCNVPGVNGGTGDELVIMGGDDDPEVNIISLFTTYSNCQKIKASVQAGIDVNVDIQLPQVQGPSQLDASYDNEIIAHEFGHGISTRLVGGRSNSGCLSNDEQMGEGWSDYFSLVTLTTSADQGIDPRGVGAYSANTNDGVGIRTFPYSTDFSINPKTYIDIVGTTAPHPLGEVWTACLWDLYWKMVDLYGFSDDITDEASGNYKAVHMVYEALKMTPCNPGFVGARDAIFAADEVLFNGEHKCMIWEVFARRGIGYLADEGDTNDRNDLVESFEALPTCIAELKIKKELEGFVEVGGIVTQKITVTNHQPETLTSVTVKETLPEGLSYVDGSSSVDVNVDGSTLTWEIGTMEYEAVVDFTYQVESDVNYWSKGYFFDGFEDGDGLWDVYTNPNEGTEAYWDLGTGDAYEGDFSFFINEVITETDNAVYLYEAQELIGDKPALKFRHRYNTEKGADAGFVSVREEGEEAWTRLLSTSALRNGYNSAIQYGTFAIPSLDGFSGSTDGEWIDSYFDLTPWKGKKIQVEFRFGTDDNIIAENEFVNGWAIDNVEFIDVLKYDVTACVTSDQTTKECLSDEIFVDSKTVVGVNNVQPDDFDLDVVPNPASEQINLTIQADKAGDLDIRVFAVDGRQVKMREFRAYQGENTYTLNIEDIPGGMYTIIVRGNGKNSIMKFVKE